MNIILAKQAQSLLKKITNNEQKFVLEHFLTEKPEIEIDNILNSDSANALRSLIFSFPVNIEEKKSDYIDFLAEYFPDILCVVIFSPNEEARQNQESRGQIIQIIYAKLSTSESFARSFLDYYTLLKIQDNEQSLPTIDLDQIAPSVAREYHKSNQQDKDKFFNYYLGGLGRSIVFSIFGYGILYQLLYGSTNDQIASDLQTVLLSQEQPKRIAEEKQSPSKILTSLISAETQLSLTSRALEANTESSPRSSTSVRTTPTTSPSSSSASGILPISSEFSPAAPPTSKHPIVSTPEFSPASASIPASESSQLATVLRFTYIPETKGSLPRKKLKNQLEIKEMEETDPNTDSWLTTNTDSWLTIKN